FKLSAAAVLDQNDLAGYFGRFYGICGGVALAVQIWVTGRLLERYGILASLLPLPLGLALGSGASAASATPGLFVSSLAKGSDTIFRYTINDASMQLLYVPVAPPVRVRAQPGRVARAKAPRSLQLAVLAAQRGDHARAAHGARWRTGYRPARAHPRPAAGAGSGLHARAALLAPAPGRGREGLRPGAARRAAQARPAHRHARAAARSGRGGARRGARC